MAERVGFHICGGRYQTNANKFCHILTLKSGVATTESHMWFSVGKVLREG